MIEPIMFIGIGFLVAGLLVIGVIPLVHARAVRLTMRRLEAATPMSIAEIQADKDQLRAEFAMSTRRLEMSVEQMKAKTTSQLAEIGKKSEAIGRLQARARRKDRGDVRARGEGEAAHRGGARTRTGDCRSSTEALCRRPSVAFGASRPRSARSPAELDDSTRTADSQRVELVALRAQVEALQGQIEAYESEAQGPE